MPESSSDSSASSEAPSWVRVLVTAALVAGATMVVWATVDALIRRRALLAPAGPGGLNHHGGPAQAPTEALSGRSGDAEEVGADD